MRSFGKLIPVMCLLAAPVLISAQVKLQVKPYSVSVDLREVANRKLFAISPGVQALLAKNLFAVVPADYEQMFHIYEQNDENYVPSFVSVDSVVHLYHVFFGSILRQLEEETLLPLARDFTGKLL